MSFKTAGKVWDADLPTTQKYVLLALADHADHEGHNAWPSVKTLGRKTGLGERTVQRALRALEDVGVIVRRESKSEYGTHVYDVPHAKLDEMALPPVTVAPRHSGTPATQAPEGVSLTTVDPRHSGTQTGQEQPGVEQGEGPPWSPSMIRGRESG